MEFLKRNYVQYGLFMCGAIVLCLIYMYTTGTSFDGKSPVFAFGAFVVPFIIWFLGIRARKKQLKGKLTFKQGLLEGFKISLVYGIVSPFIFLAYYIMVPSSIDYMRSAYHMEDAEVPAIIALDMVIQLVSAIIFGTIYGAVISFFLKSKKK